MDGGDRPGGSTYELETILDLVSRLSGKGFLVSGSDGLIHFASPEAARLLGYSGPTELTGRPATDFYSDPGLREYLMGGLGDHGEIQGFEVMMRRADGSDIGVTGKGVVDKDPFGKPSCAVFFFSAMPDRPATVRQGVAGTGIESREVLDRVLALSSEAILVSGPDGNIQYANQKAADMLGCQTSDELIGFPAIALYGEPVYRQKLLDVLSKLGCIQGFETTARRIDGSTVHIAGSALAQVAEDGVAQFVVVLLQDISERKEVDSKLIEAHHGLEIKVQERTAELRQAVKSLQQEIGERKQAQAQLAQADRLASVGLLAAGVAHEINNPLTFVLLNIEELDRRLPEFALEPGVHQELSKRIGEIVQGSIRIRDIVQDLKTFSRTGKDHTKPTDVNRVIKSTMKLVANEIRFRAQLVKSLGEIPMVQADEGRLSQVVLNILVNAAQAIEDGQVDSNVIQVRTWTENDQVMIEVSDSGSGIPEENLPKLFDPFFTTKPVGEGAGLGLYVCHNIVRSLGGWIEAASSLEGSRFRIVLPASQEVLDEMPEPREPARSVRGRVLVIDDEILIGKSVSRILRADHDVTIATSGVEAQELLQSGEKFDVILCDLMMPGMTGMDLYGWISKELPGHVDRMFFFTGGAFTPQAQKFRQEVNRPFLDKPFDADKLRSVVNEWSSVARRKD